MISDSAISKGAPIFPSDKRSSEEGSRVFGGLAVSHPAESKDQPKRVRRMVWRRRKAGWRSQNFIFTVRAGEFTSVYTQICNGTHSGSRGPAGGHTHTHGWTTRARQLLGTTCKPHTQTKCRRAVLMPPTTAADPQHTQPSCTTPHPAAAAASAAATAPVRCDLPFHHFLFKFAQIFF